MNGLVHFPLVLLFVLEQSENLIFFKMVTIAVAGGTSPSLGRSIVTAISQTSNKPVILTRQSANAPNTKYGAEVRQVDYTDQASLVEALKDVHTVISVLKIPGPEWMTYEINLLNAAKQAGCKRFAPSQFEMGPAADGHIDILAMKPLVWKECENSGLECARFNGGMFMNYLGFGKDFGGDEARKLDVLQGLIDDPIIWDIANGVAEVPVKEDRSTPKLTMTDVKDIGRFVAAACELPDGKWESSMEIVGDTVSIDEVTEMIEAVTGKNMKRKALDRAELKKCADAIEGFGGSRKEMMDKLVYQTNLLMLDEKEGANILRPVVNRLCPSVKPTTVREYLAKAWRA